MLALTTNPFWSGWSPDLATSEEKAHLRSQIHWMARSIFADNPHETVASSLRAAIRNTTKMWLVFGPSKSSEKELAFWNRETPWCRRDTPEWQDLFIHRAPPSGAAIQVLNLNPLESDCAICGKHLFDCRLGIPFYESKPVPNNWSGDWVGRDVCGVCFRAHEEWSKRIESRDAP
jgi:hypothetical protein